MDHNTPYEKWTHPAERVEITNATDYIKCMYEIYTDGSKSEAGVGAGLVVFCDDEIGRNYDSNYHPVVPIIRLNS